ncbi:MAG: sigma-70 family RNA polymerase sigma factor [Phycisphaerae bacterium]|nr:sigma-70 family RNA polymerase sigma factor [Phycisphaerae bacterium]
MAGLYRRYWRAARAAAYGVTGDLSLAEDAASDGFYLALQGLADLNDPARFGPWLRTIVIRSARRAKAAKARHKGGGLQEWPDTEAPPTSERCGNGDPGREQTHGPGSGTSDAEAARPAQSAAGTGFRCPVGGHARGGEGASSSTRVARCIPSVLAVAHAEETRGPSGPIRTDRGDAPGVDGPMAGAFSQGRGSGTPRGPGVTGDSGGPASVQGLAA